MRMLMKLFKSRSGSNERLGLEEFRKLVETYEFRRGDRFEARTEI